MTVFEKLLLVHLGTYTDRTLNTIRHQALDCPVGVSTAGPDQRPEGLP